MRKHPATLKKAGISPARYQELKAICEQYNDYINGYLGRMGQQREHIIRAPARAIKGEDWHMLIDDTLIEGEPERAFYRQRMLFYVRLHQNLGFDK